MSRGSTGLSTGIGLICPVLLLAAGCFGGGGGSSGSGGSTGGTGTGGTTQATTVMKDPSNYAQTAGAAFPYPQGHASSTCTFPVYDTDDVYTAFQNWKGKYFDGTKVVRPENGNDTVSEGIGYGMLIGVFMNDQSMFDALWSYAKSHNDGHGLMTWCVPGGSGSCSGGGSATDGDEDMAYALLMASKQWPTKASYASDATALINAIMQYEVDSGSNVLKPGDNFGGPSEMNPSYLAPAYYRAFARATGNSKWMNVLDESYTIVAAASGQYGLVPNWATSSGSGIAGPTSDGSGPNFGYDACRVPFRIGLDYCLNGETRAQHYAGLIAGFFASKSTATSLSGINDGYTPAGANPSGALGDYPAGMAFTGPAGVAAMAAGNDTLRDISYRTQWADTTQGAMKISGVFTYYNASWGVLSLMANSGNFWDMTQ
jgi:endo-1,4-beta-D-glucanase Y